ncbi:MAG: hypothetical protein DME01_11460 [Candidatus Rokuibacteriota bacterium]|nr:MAG: hypothetical protein DME01_11460 [Candidatus Rokubacteria bacterium]
MTCLDVREQFSALVDDALAPGERAALDAHLATCADCRRELQRFRDTVALVRAVAPVRAPAGFVERVLEAARPDPWYRRLVRGLFLPWPVKLPMEAAAIVLVAVGVAVVYRGTREIEPSARLDSIAPAVRQAPERAAPQALTPTPQRETDARRAQNDARKLKTAKDQTQAPEPPKGPAPAETIHKKAAETPERREKQEPEVAAKPDAPPSARERAMTREYARSRPAPAPGARADAQAPRSTPSVTGSSYAFTPADVSGRLTVSDRDAALRGVAELATRLGAVANRRVDTPDLQILELTVPRDAYDEFVRELARLGRWQPGREPSALPARVRVVLQITR